MLLLLGTLLTVICFYSFQSFTLEYLAITYSTSYALVSLFYLVTIILLRRSFGNLDLGGLNSEKASVYTQFLFFMIAFIFRTIYYMAQIYLDGVKESPQNHFRRCMIESVGIILVNVLPLTFQVIVHYRTYKR